MHTSAYEDCVRFANKYLDRGQRLRIADVGSCDVNGCLRPIFSHWDYVGFDIVEGPNVDLVIPEESGWGVGFADQFDVVVSTQVMEHVRRPWKWINDLVAICRPGGLVYISTPNSIGYHAHPIDCWRAWPDGMRALMEEGGLKVLESDWPAGTIDTTGIGRKV